MTAADRDTTASDSVWSGEQCLSGNHVQVVDPLLSLAEHLRAGTKQDAKLAHRRMPATHQKSSVATYTIAEHAHTIIGPQDAQYACRFTLLWRYCVSSVVVLWLPR